MRRLWGNSARLALASIAAICLTACAPEKKYKVLSAFFDGVPKPGTEAPAKTQLARLSRDVKETSEPKEILEVKPVQPLPVPAVPAEKPKLPIETLHIWEEALKLLPTDMVGGPDWIKALKEGVIAPLARVDSIPELPYTLDTLVPAVLTENRPALAFDVEMVPTNAPFYKVVFPHSSHTLWLNCSSCHPGILAKKAGMQKILGGEYCGACHGKVSFNPLNGCPRCHVNLVPAGPKSIEADLVRAHAGSTPGSAQVLERGKKAYLQACAVCHGEKGDGKGPLAAALDPKPRNFTSGKFKFRSTPSASIPLDSDLFRTITRGIPGTSMPSFSMLPYEDRFAILHFIKTFSERFAKEKPAAELNISEPPPPTPALLETGKKFYKEAECFKCHGESGRGDGPSAPELKDDWEDPLRPFDFTRGRPKSGSSLKDYYRVVMTGLQGTPMPDYGDVFEQEQAWGVVQYVFSLGQENRALPPAVRGDILFERKVPEQGEKIPPALFPHWFHRIRIRCAVCHPSVFQMKAGAANMTMEEMRQKKFCGKCHNGTVAWPIAFETCVRCHANR